MKKIKQILAQIDEYRSKLDTCIQDLRQSTILASADSEQVECVIEPLLTTDDVVKIFSVDKSTIWRWRKMGYLPFLNLGGKIRFKRQDILELIDGK